MTFHIAFGNAPIADPQALTIFAVERLGEIRASGPKLIDQVEAIHSRFDALDREQTQSAAIETMIASEPRVPVATLRGIARLFGEPNPGVAADMIARFDHVVDDVEQAWRIVDRQDFESDFAPAQAILGQALPMGASPDDGARSHRAPAAGRLAIHILHRSAVWQSPHSGSCLRRLTLPLRLHPC